MKKKTSPHQNSVLKSHAETQLFLIIIELTVNRELLDLAVKERYSLSRLQDCYEKMIFTFDFNCVLALMLLIFS